MEFQIKSNIEIKEITDAEFAPMVSDAADNFFRIYNYFRQNNVAALKKKNFSDLAQICHGLECFLDDSGARANKCWVYFVELVASIRNLSIASYIMRHVLDRQTDYHCNKNELSLEDFLTEGIHTLEFLYASIIDLGKAVEGESKKLSVKTSRAVYKYPKNTKETYYVLSKNLQESVVEKKEERVVELIHKVRKVAKISKQEEIKKETDSEKLALMIPARLNEKKIRKLKNIIHGVQSDYDTYVKNTVVEKENPDLKLLRGFFSIPLHLLEMVRWLSHFYERHEDAIRHSEETEKIAAIVDKSEILDRIINYGFYYSDLYLQKAKKTAEKILNLYVKPVQYELTLPPKGIHARPATYISLIVNEHGTDVFLLVNGEKYNAKSVMNLMMAAGIIYDLGYKTVTFEGDKRVLDDLKILSEHNYCEDQEIPRELNYLRILRNVGSPII